MPNLHRLTASDSLKSRLNLFIISCKVEGLSTLTIQGYQYKINRFIEFATCMTFLFVFPFDFTVVPEADVRPILEMIAKIVLIAISVAIGVEILIRFMKLMIAVRKKDTIH